MSEMLKAVIVSIVEGITEFLPVSSTGHMILVSDLIDFHGKNVESFEIFIQLGAILAVVVLYYDRFLALLDFKTRDAFTGIRAMSCLAAGGIPVCFMGLLFHKTIKHYLFYPIPVATALIVGGILMISLDSKQREVKVSTLADLTPKTALFIGVAQCLALWPGMSRSGSTIIGGLLLGLDRKVAAEFSFLVAVPVMCLAVGYDLLKSLDHLSATDIPMFAVGFIVSFIVAVLAVKGFISLLASWTLKPFGWYRVALGAVVVYLLW